MSDGNDDQKRNLPSWMNNRKKKKQPADDESNEQKQINVALEKKPKGSDSSFNNFSKLMEGVVFVLSGFVNPERATLRSQALEMGADYRQDWDSESTLLVCAYSNTPKFRQVEADNGTVVKKEWISDCYNQKKLVEIDSYLMRAGRPWRKSSSIVENSCDRKPSPPKKSTKQVESKSQSEKTIPSSSKSRASHPAKAHFSHSKVKEWAADDLSRTISWLESQEEKPEPSEINEIAAGGILICLQDAIDSIEQDQDIRQIANQWNIVPQAVEELIKLVDGGKNSKEDLCKQLKECKQMYEAELKKLNNDSNLKKKRRLKSDESERGSHRKASTVPSNAADYDSDKTVEMTEEEIDLAYNNIAS
ncbi:DNA-repair protein XRCC1 [Euphorbia peplus]|nr:DNA-repair protein XRCC1 [Euphorbia peplus]